MDPDQTSSSTPQNHKKSNNLWFDAIPCLPDDPTHPTQVALRTYALSLSLSLGPSLVPFVTAFFTPASKKQGRTGSQALREVLRRELGFDGFAFAITVAVGGGATIKHLWNSLDSSVSLRGTKNFNPPLGRDLGLISRTLIKLKALSSSLNLSNAQKTFIANLLSSSLAIVLLQAGRRRSLRLRKISAPASSTIPLTAPNSGPPSGQGTSPTLDLTLLLLVRAVDAVVQTFVFQKSEPKRRALSSRQDRQAYAEPNLVKESLRREQEKQESSRKRQRLTMRIDALVFWACSARIMWCFFYGPERLPRSYVKWINTLANLDHRLLDALRGVRSRTWTYINGSPSHPHLLTSYARELGFPSSWGDPALLPAYGGWGANAVWKSLGVKNRSNIGGLPCELVHGSVVGSSGLAGSCTANAGVRAVQAFLEAVAIYLPVHFLPILLTRPRTLFHLHRTLSTFLAALRSAAFLSTFVSSYWYTVCVTRTLVFARLFPFISHDFWDGPYGCVLAGCLVCGSSIWIENGRRRGEMALYVLPRAVRACLPDAWARSGNRGVRLAERIAFMLSISSLLTAAIHQPNSLRGLSRWTLAFVMKGPNAGFWKRKRQSPSIPPTPSMPPTPIDTADAGVLYTPRPTSEL